MNRSATITGAFFLALGLSVFVWKALWLQLPIFPSGGEGLWRVELEISARGAGRRASVRAALPEAGPGQAITVERQASAGLDFRRRKEEGQTLGVWSGRFDGVHEIAYGFRVKSHAVHTPLSSRLDETPAPLSPRFLSRSSELPADHEAVVTLLRDLGTGDLESAVARVTTIFAFASSEIATVSTASDDAVLTLAAREGNARGKARLLTTLLRGAGIPARLVGGLHLERERGPSETEWVEAWLGKWVPMSPTHGFFAERPEGFIAMRPGGLALVESTGLDAVGHRFFAIREQLRPEELASHMVPPNRALAKLSLYRLPLRTQESLRIMLVLPLGALVVALYRNLIGLGTFGTFMPILLALALRATSLGLGLAMVAGTLLFGITSRLLLDRLRLLMVPRLSVLLCLVVLATTGFALTGRGFEVHGLYGGALFPLVILTMLIERFSITIAEEGMKEGMKQAAGSVIVAVTAFPIFRSDAVADLLFGFPELLFAVMGLLVWIGAYNGYRVWDLIRFRSLATPA